MASGVLAVLFCMIFFIYAYIKTAKQGKIMLENRINKTRKGAHMVKRTAKNAAPKAEKENAPRAARPEDSRRRGSGSAGPCSAGSPTFIRMCPVGDGRAVSAVSGLSQEPPRRRSKRQSAPLYEDADVSVTIYEQTYRVPVRDVLENVTRRSPRRTPCGRTHGNPLARMWDVVTAVFGRGEAQPGGHCVNEERG